MEIYVSFSGENVLSTLLAEFLKLRSCEIINTCQFPQAYFCTKPEIVSKSFWF